MADAFDVSSQALPGYGSVGAAGVRGLQTEVMRRLQLDAIAKAQARQAELDKLNAEKMRADIDTNAETRQALADQRNAAALKTGQQSFESTHVPGADISTADEAIANKVGLGHLILQGPRMVQPDATASVAPGIALPDAEQPPAPAPMPTPELHKTYAGTPEQQFANDILDGKYDSKFGDNPSLLAYLKATSAERLSGRTTGSTPAGVVAPKTPVEKDAAKHLDIQTRVATKPDSVTPEEKAWDTAYLQQHPDESTKQSERQTNLRISVDAAGARQQAGFTNKAIEDDYNKIQDRYVKEVAPFKAKAEKLLDDLSAPGGVNDVVAVPSFLSFMAGGIGNGLRMSQAELNMIQRARPGIESLAIKLKNLALGYTALTPDQREQMKALVRKVAAHQVEFGNKLLDASDALGDPTKMTTKGAHKIVSDLERYELNQFADSVTDDATTEPAAPALNSRIPASLQAPPASPAPAVRFAPVPSHGGR